MKNKEFRDFLNKMIANKRSKMEELQRKSDASNDLNEVRSIGKTLQALRDEIADVEDQLKKLDESEGDNNGDDNGSDNGGNNGGNNGDDNGDDNKEGRSGAPKGAELRNGFAKVGSFGYGKEKRAEETDRHNTPEYRKAFMEYVCRGTQIPAELRKDEVTGITDAAAVVPTTILTEIIQKLETYGNVYKLVRKLNVQGGVAIPILSLKPEAKWIGEGKSEDQKLNASESVTFLYYGVECKIAQTLLASVVTLEAFQQLFVQLAAEAIVKAVEISIFNGTGTNQPTGILKDTRIPQGNVITLTPAEFKSWSAWHEKVKAKMKKAYRDGTFFMNQATFDGQIDGMVDTNGQPIGRTNYGINGEETFRFMGKPVETVEDGCLPTFEDANTNDVVAVFMKPTDYAINSNMEMTVVKWTDNDTNEVKNKAVMICDGKLVDPNGVLIIKKGAEA